LTGAIGEEACKALLQHEKIRLEEVSNTLYELADLKVAGLPYYIDCKYYSDSTLDHFALLPDDPLWHPKLNEERFKEHALEKLTRIRGYHNTPVKLIYLNLTSSQPRPLGYYDSAWKPVTHLAEATFVLVQGCLELQNPNNYQIAFINFVKELQANLASQEEK
jgi:hypothetical protein